MTVQERGRSGGRRRRREFELKLKDLDPDHAQVPQAIYLSHATMRAAEFQRICKDLSVVGEAVTITLKRGSINFSTSGEIGKANINLRNDRDPARQEDYIEVDFNEEPEIEPQRDESDNSDFGGDGALTLRRVSHERLPEDSGRNEPQTEQELSLSFALRFLVSFTKATPFSTNVRISMQKKLPLRVTYEFEGGVSVNHYLAPKLDDDDDDDS